MQIFDDIRRTDAGPAKYAEDRFSYYNRSARVGVFNIRNLLESWFSNYPAHAKGELAARFRADFDAAFFELFLHELMLRLGVDVSVHPLTGHSTRPDFGLKENGSLAYLEARVAQDESAEAERRRKVVEGLYDQINKVPIPDFFIRVVELRVISKRQPSMRKALSQLRIWLENLDYGLLRTQSFDSLTAYPSWIYRDASLSFKVSAMPVSENRRADPNHRPIGILPMETRWGDSARCLRRALQRKASKYGPLVNPFIIAVNSISRWGSDRIDQMQALFGREQFVIEARDSEPRMVRARDGFWSGPTGPTHRRVSAVLFCEVGPWSVDDAPMRLYHNPWALRPYTGALTSLPQAIPQLPTMAFTEGRKIGEILAVADEWLGE